MSDRIILGQRNSGEYGLWVSKPTKSVWSTDSNDFLFDMTSILGLEHSRGIINVPVQSTTTVFTVYHNLGYVPVVIAQPLFQGPPVDSKVWVSGVYFIYRLYSHTDRIEYKVERFSGDTKNVIEVDLAYTILKVPFY